MYVRTSADSFNQENTLEPLGGKGNEPGWRLQENRHPGFAQGGESVGARGVAAAPGGACLDRLRHLEELHSGESSWEKQNPKGFIVFVLGDILRLEWR